MRKRSRIGFAILLVAALGGIAWLVRVQREPAYQGRLLTSWLEEGVSNEGVSARSETAIRAMGTNALPTLLAMVRVRDSAFRKGLLELNARQKWVTIHIHPRGVMVQMAAYGFSILGPSARPAIPELVRDLDDSDPEVRTLAAYCLAEIRPNAQEAFPALAKFLDNALKRNAGTNWDSAELALAAFVLGEMGAAARPAIPQLTTLCNVTNRPDSAVALSAKAALIKINGESVLPYIEPLRDTTDQTNWHRATTLIYYLGTNAEPAIPVLLATLQQTNVGPQIQWRTIWLLGRIHKQPEVCVPAIRPFLQSTNSDVQHVAALALLKLDPEAAAKAGVK